MDIGCATSVSDDQNFSGMLTLSVGYCKALHLSLGKGKTSELLVAGLVGANPRVLFSHGFWKGKEVVRKQKETSGGEFESSFRCGGRFEGNATHVGPLPRKRRCLAGWEDIPLSAGPSTYSACHLVLRIGRHTNCALSNDADWVIT